MEDRKYCDDLCHFICLSHINPQTFVMIDCFYQISSIVTDSQNVSCIDASSIPLIFQFINIDFWSAGLGQLDVGCQIAGGRPQDVRHCRGRKTRTKRRKTRHRKKRYLDCFVSYVIDLTTKKGGTTYRTWYHIQYQPFDGIMRHSGRFTFSADEKQQRSRVGMDSHALRITT